MFNFYGENYLQQIWKTNYILYNNYKITIYSHTLCRFATSLNNSWNTITSPNGLHLAPINPLLTTPLKMSCYIIQIFIIVPYVLNGQPYVHLIIKLLKNLKILVLWHYVIVLVTLGQIFFIHPLFLLHLAMFINDNWYNCAFLVGKGRHHCINISNNIWEAQVGLSKHLLFSSVDYKMISSLVHALLWSYVVKSIIQMIIWFYLFIFTYMNFGPMVLE